MGEARIQEPRMDRPQPQSEPQQVELAEAPTVDELRQLDQPVTQDGVAQHDIATEPMQQKTAEPTDEEFFGTEAMAAYNKGVAEERAGLLSSDAIQNNLLALHTALEGRIAELDTERKGFMGMIKNLRDKIQTFMTTETAMKGTRDQVMDMMTRVASSTDPAEQNKILGEIANLKLDTRVMEDYYAATADTSPVSLPERPAMNANTPFSMPIGAAPPRASEQLSRRPSAKEVHGSDYGMQPGDDAIDAQIQSALRENYETIYPNTAEPTDAEFFGEENTSEPEDTGSTTDYDLTSTPQVTATKREVVAPAAKKQESVDTAMELPVLTPDVAARELVLNPTQRTLQVLEHSYDKQSNPRDAQQIATLLAREYIKRELPAKARDWTKKVTDPTEREHLQNDLTELPTEPISAQPVQ